jgi:hypothetical protein
MAPKNGRIRKTPVPEYLKTKGLSPIDLFKLGREARITLEDRLGFPCHFSEALNRYGSMEGDTDLRNNLDATASKQGPIDIDDVALPHPGVAAFFPAEPPFHFQDRAKAIELLLQCYVLEEEAPAETRIEKKTVAEDGTERKSTVEDTRLDESIKKAWREIDTIFQAMKSKVGFSGRTANLESELKRVAFETFYRNEFKYVKEEHLRLDGLYCLAEQAHRDFFARLLPRIIYDKVGKKIAGQKTFKKYRKIVGTD